MTVWYTWWNWMKDMMYFFGELLFTVGMVSYTIYYELEISMHEVIVDEGEARINYHLIEIESE